MSVSGNLSCSLVLFDQQGVIGPVVSLLTNGNYLNASGLEELTQYLQQQFEKISGQKATARKEFCEMVVERKGSGDSVTITEMIGSDFFQSMQRSGKPPEYHSRVMEAIVPKTIEFVRERLPNIQFQDKEEPLFREWVGGLLETYMSEKDVLSVYQKKESDNTELLDRRRKVGTKLYQLTQAGKFSEDDLNVFLKACQVALKTLEQSPHPSEAKDITGEYLRLFSLADSSLSDDVLSKIDGIFRKKIFPHVEN